MTNIQPIFDAFIKVALPAGSYTPDTVDRLKSAWQKAWAMFDICPLCEGKGHFTVNGRRWCRHCGGWGRINKKEGEI
jgi:DnaJ-class molecular chaperone